MKNYIPNCEQLMEDEIVIINDMKHLDVLKDERFTILGLPFCKKNKNYFRNSESYRDEIEKTNQAINWLGNNTAGGAVTFKTNAKTLAVKVKLNKCADLWHMARTGEIGFDLYASFDGRLRFLNVTRIEKNCSEYEAVLLAYCDDSESEKEILINFPLYSGIIDLKILINKEADITKYSRFDVKKWLFYGTSITQGGCASRPGMCYTNILSRHYQKEIINLGYSANGLGENVIARMINEIDDLEMVLIDYDANAGAINTLKPTLENFIDTLKQKNKDLKVVVISRVLQIQYLTEKFILDKYMDCRAFEMETVKKLNEKYGNVFFIDGLKLFKDDYDEYTVDNLHFTDLGFYFFSKNLIPYIDDIIKKE